MMTEKKRLLDTFNNKKVDRPACICPGGMMNMITEELMQQINVFWPSAHCNSEQMAVMSKAVYELELFENYGLPFCMTVEAEAMGSTINMGNARIEPHITNYILNSSSEYPKLTPINLSSGRVKTVLDAITILQKLNTEVPIIANLTGPISLATSLVNPSTLYREMKTDKDNVHKLLEFLSQELISFGIEQAKNGADAINIADPSASGEILGPKNFQEFVVPYLSRIINRIKDATNIKIILHICGDMKDVVEKLNFLSADAYSFDSMVNISSIKCKIKDKIIMGNINTFMIEQGTKDKIKQSTINCINSGYNIISPACGLGVCSSIENVKTILSTVKEVCNV